MATTLFADDEVALGERFRAGDEDAMRDVYERYGAPCTPSPGPCCATGSRPSDAVQQALLQAWRSADRFDPSRKLGPWLNQITRRACIDAYRRDRRFESDPGATSPWMAGPSVGGSTEAGSTTLPRSSVAGWRPRCGEPSTSCHRPRRAWRGWPTRRPHASRDRQPARVPVGTVKSRTARAHVRLARLLSHLDSLPA